MHQKVSNQHLLPILVAAICLPVIRAEASAIRLAQAASTAQGCVGERVPPQQRIENCTRLINEKPDHANAFHNRAIAYRKKGDMAHAMKDATEYERLSGKSPDR